jgi:hypothetical protein
MPTGPAESSSTRQPSSTTGIGSDQDRRAAHRKGDRQRMDKVLVS